MIAEEQLPDNPISAEEAQKIADDVKEMQANLLAFANRFRGRTGVDQRWLSIGITDVEKGVMFLSKAILEAPLKAAIAEAEKEMRG